MCYDNKLIKNMPWKKKMGIGNNNKLMMLFLSDSSEDFFFLFVHFFKNLNWDGFDHIIS